MHKQPAVLELEGIRKRYGRLTALDDVSLRIDAGEFVGLLGPNGAGKSTLFQIAAGLFSPDSGEVRLFGRSYRDSASAILRHVGVVFQARSLDLEMSVVENLKFHGGLFGLSGRILRDRIAELAGLLRFQEHMGRPVRTLSGGQQRRIEIARALLSRPNLLLMDEPSAGLDTTARQEVVRYVREITTEGRVSVLWATHLVDEVADADRFIILAHGRKIAEGRPTDVARHWGAGSLAEAYILLTGAASKPNVSPEPD